MTDTTHLELITMTDRNITIVTDSGNERSGLMLRLTPTFLVMMDDERGLCFIRKSSIEIMETTDVKD